ncbi:unnamed protein product [Adineta ricciae]|uniref:EGF domain-specific O-linked N-acetylglucosamine transferase n=1 Tax=Adineta ricciae TaxID=249248 RepID=A0A813WJA7_ADIRI|nr:unnamed protein product [Adineta ricciae]
MAFNNYCSKLCMQYRHRRRRYFLLNLFVITLCLCAIFPFKYHIFQLSPSKPLPRNSSFSDLLRKEMTLNCTGDPLTTWCAAEMKYCNSSLLIYKNLFFLTRSAILQTIHAEGKRVGGEQIQAVLNQAENDEYFHFKKDFLQIPCNASLPRGITLQYHLSKILSSITSYQTSANADLIVNESTIAVNRHDYANIYHTMTDLYTAYILCRFFQRDPKSVRILFLDAHPHGNLDVYWSKLFHSYSRLGHLKKYSKILYHEIIWAQPQAQSDIDVQRHRKQTPSFFADFRQHMLKQFHADSTATRTVNCESLQIFYLGRRNYVAHPRNPSGKVTRQLPNEKQVLETLQKKFSGYSKLNFTYNYFEQLPIEEQLQTIARTDVFIGMHGAGLTYVTMLKPNRALVELSGPSWQSQDHFQQLAIINQVRYRQCAIQDESPTVAEKIFDCTKEKVLELCPSIMT